MPRHPSVQTTSSEKSISSLQAIHMGAHGPSPREAQPALEATAQPPLYILLTAFLIGSSSGESLAHSLWSDNHLQKCPQGVSSPVVTTET